jgi:L-malate glycosyltransferase
MSTIRVLHLIKSLGRGGAETLLVEAARLADPAGLVHRVGYFLPWKDQLVPALRATGAEVECFGGRSSAAILLKAPRVAASIRRHRIDLVHAHLPVSGAVGRIAGRLAGVPVVYSEHNLQQRYHRLTRSLNARTWGWQARAIAVSGDVAESIRTHIGNSVRIDTVLNGVNTNRFVRHEHTNPALRNALGIPAGAPLVGTVAVFRTQKRLDLWLQAAARIREAVPAVRFLIIGDGPLREQVQASIAELGLAEVTIRPGLQADVRPYLAEMDVFMMSSEFEGLPVALLEAMAMQCVPVCTAVGGIPEAITHGQNGVTVAPGDANGLAESVVTLLADRQRLAALGVAGRATVIERFSMQRMADDLERIYREVLSERVP